MQFEIAQRREIICFLHLRLNNLYYVQTSHFCGSVAADFDCVGRQERDEKIIAAFATGTLKIVARSRVIWERKTFQSSPINFSHFNARLTSEKKRFFFLHSFFFHAQSGCSGIEQKRTFLSRSNKERQALIFSSPFQTLLGSFGLGAIIEKHASPFSMDIHVRWRNSFTAGSPFFCEAVIRVPKNALAKNGWKRE